MRANVLEIPTLNRENQRKLGLDLSIREAVRSHLRHRWPTHTAKIAARHYDLSLDRAREAAAGRVSLTTLERIFKKGGWSVALPIVAAVIGQQIANYIIELRASHHENSERLGALLGNGWPVGPPRGDDPAGLDHGSLERRQFSRRRMGG